MERHGYKTPFQVREEFNSRLNGGGMNIITQLSRKLGAVQKVIKLILKNEGQRQ